MIPQLPVGIADFARVQSDPDLLYVDKTQALAALLAHRAAPHMFLARPRRFGKTLMLDTVACLFQGRRDLFAGTWIGQAGNWDWEGQTRPVLHLDLALDNPHSPEAVRAELHDLVEAEVRRHAPDLPRAVSPARTLSWLLERMAAAGPKVVVLVDEYDSALTDNLDQSPAVREGILNVLRSFYRVLKASHQCIQYTLVTGIVRLAHAGLFSGANHLRDLSHRRDVNGLLGFTHAEIHQASMAALVQQGAMHLGCTSHALYAALEDHYNGYRFAEGQEAVFNPFTLAGCLQDLGDPTEATKWSLERLPRTWAETGTPDMLLRGLRTSRIQALPDPTGTAARPLLAARFDAGRPHVPTLLLHAGYLTLDAATPPALTSPNREVQEAFAVSLTEWFATRAPESLAERRIPRMATAMQLQTALASGDKAVLASLLSGCLQAVPHALQRFGPDRDQPYEAYWQALLHVLCQSLDLPLVAEPVVGGGRADLVVELPDRICVLELKVQQTAQTALQQALGTFYADAFHRRSKPVIVWGIAFDRDKQTVRECLSWDLGVYDMRLRQWEREPWDVTLGELRTWEEEVRTRYVRTTHPGT